MTKRVNLVAVFLWSTAWFSFLYGAVTLFGRDQKVRWIELAVAPILAAGAAVLLALYGFTLARWGKVAAVGASGLVLVVFAVIVMLLFRTVGAETERTVPTLWTFVVAVVAAGLGYAWLKLRKSRRQEA